jgi:alpha-1,3-rhamnosyltransferase
MNQNNPKVSIRMSAYNHEAYVEEAILSVLNQSFQDFELLVIDDGSSDRTPEILERLSQEHGFYFERQKNMGLTKTLNKLVGLCRGEYITGIASDDMHAPERLATQVEALESNPKAAFVYGKMQAIDKNGEALEADTTFGDFSAGADTGRLMLRRGMFFAAPTVMIRRSAYDSVGPYDQSLPFEDYDWFFRCTRKFEAVGLDAVLLYYRKHDSNLSLAPQNRRKMFDGEQRMFRKYLWKPYFPIMLYHRIPSWLGLSIECGTKDRFFFALLFPLYLFHRKRTRYLSNAGRVLLPAVAYDGILTVLRKLKRFRNGGVNL